MFVPFVFIVGCRTSFTTKPRGSNPGGDANVAAAVMISGGNQ